jgi:hypothetical protein
MRALLPLIALVALSIGCSNSSSAVLGPTEDETASACRGESGNCGGGQHNNNPNNPPATAP